MNIPLQIATSIKAFVATATKALQSALTRPRPLKTQLLALALASGLPIAVFSGILLWHLSVREQAHYEETLRRTALNFAADIDRQLALMLAILKTLATSQMLQSERFAEFHSQALEAIGTQPFAIILADSSGMQIANTRVAYGTKLPTIADTATLAKVVASKQTAVSNLFIGNVSQVPQLNIHVPVLRNGELRFDLVMAFSPDLLRDISVQQHVPEGWVVGISDGNGRIIARTKEHERYVNMPLPPELANRRREARAYAANRVDGTPVLRAVTPLKNADWTVAATVEWPAVTAAVRDASAVLILVGLLLAGTVAIVARWLSHTVTSEFNSLAAATRQLGEGVPVQPTDGLVSELNDVKHTIVAVAARQAAHEAERELLVRELNHRVKNAFAVLQSILNATLRNTTDPAAFADSFKGRLHSMAAAQEILTSRDWSSAELGRLARGQLAAFLGSGNSRVSISGPAVELPAQHAVPIGLILHELGTNASKYGALSVPGGRVQLSWSVIPVAQDRERELQIVWREQGGPAVSMPDRRGFGSTLIERGLPLGNVDRQFEPGGVVCTITMPLPQIAPTATETTGRRRD